MVKLPKNLIKKHGGNLKKAWAEFKRGKSRKRTKRTSKPRRTMTRTRKASTRARSAKIVRSGGRKVVKKRIDPLLAGAMGSFAYGATRETVADFASPITEKIREWMGPAGFAVGYVDNLVLGGVGWALAKGKIPYVKKIPFSRDYGRAMLYIEAADLGQQIAGGALRLGRARAQASSVNSGGLMTVGAMA